MSGLARKQVASGLGVVLSTLNKRITAQGLHSSHGSRGAILFARLPYNPVSAWLPGVYERQGELLRQCRRRGVLQGHHGGEVSLTTSITILDRESGVNVWQLHDLRRSASTLTADALEHADEDSLDMWLMHSRKGIKGRYQKAPLFRRFERPRMIGTRCLQGSSGTKPATWFCWERRDEWRALAYHPSAPECIVPMEHKPNMY